MSGNRYIQPHELDIREDISNILQGNRVIRISNLTLSGEWQDVLVPGAILKTYFEDFGFTAEDVANKATDLISDDDIHYPTTQAVKTYADGLITGILNDRGNYDASSGVFPSSGGSAPDGSIRKGDLWYISLPGTLGITAVVTGSSVRALIDAPGQTEANWDVLSAALSYSPENNANKTTDFSVINNVLYPTTRAAVICIDNGLDGKQDNIFYTTEDSANKDTDVTLSANSDAKYTSQLAAKTYADTTISNATTVRSGSGAPSGGLGKDGDFYINTSAKTIYGPKASGSWGSPVSLTGPAGSTGTAGATGASGAGYIASTTSPFVASLGSSVLVFVDPGLAYRGGDIVQFISLSSPSSTNYVIARVHDYYYIADWNVYAISFNMVYYVGSSGLTGTSAISLAALQGLPGSDSISYSFYPTLWNGSSSVGSGTLLQDAIPSVTKIAFSANDKRGISHASILSGIRVNDILKLTREEDATRFLILRVTGKLPVIGSGSSTTYPFSVSVITTNGSFGSWWGGEAIALSVISANNGINTVQYVQPSNGATITGNNSVHIAINATGSLSSLTINFPASPQNGQSFGISSTQAIMALSLSGGSILGGISSMAANDSASWVYITGNSSWVRKG